MRDFPGGPVIKTPHFQCRGCGFNPGQGPKVPRAVWHRQEIKIRIINFKRRKRDEHFREYAI